MKFQRIRPKTISVVASTLAHFNGATIIVTRRLPIHFHYLPFEAPPALPVLVRLFFMPFFFVPHPSSLIPRPLFLVRPLVPGRSWHTIFSLPLQITAGMKKVYYKGQPYDYEVLEMNGKRLYQLYDNGILKHSVSQSELDVKSLVSLILDAYYKNSRSIFESEPLG